MKIFLIFTFFLVSLQVSAVCRVFIPKDTFYHESGYSIKFDVDGLLHERGYSVAIDPEDADYTLLIEGQQLPGRFKKAQALMEMGEIRSENTVLCLYMSCSINNFARAFRKTYLDFSKKLPFCDLDH